MSLFAPLKAPKPTSAPAQRGWVARVDALVRTGRHKEALGAVLPMLQAPPLDKDALNIAATCYWALDDTKTAYALMQVATQTWTEEAWIWSKTASMALSLGDFAAAEAGFRKSLRLNPNNVNALASLNRLSPLDRQGTHARRLRKLAISGELSARDKATAFNALGRIEERAGHHKAAFRAFSRFRAASLGTYDPAQTDRIVTDQIRLYRPIEAEARDAARFVFIVGLPRSGTTLTERILARHPDVRSIGESVALRDTMRALRSYVAKTHGQNGPWDWYDYMTPELIQSFRNRFLAAAGVTEADAGRVIVDKMPLDALDMGLAQVLLPEARFVFMLRHPLDTGLSIYCTNFHTGNGFASKQVWIAHVMRAVYRSLDDYQPKLGAALRAQSYSALVDAPEPQVRALLDHAGLSWNVNCLDPERDDRAVHTASLTQVRSGINRSGLDKWRPYRAELSPLIEGLGGWDWIDAWHARNARAARLAPD